MRMRGCDYRRVYDRVRAVPGRGRPRRRAGRVVPMGVGRTEGFRRLPAKSFLTAHVTRAIVAGCRSREACVALRLLPRTNSPGLANCCGGIDFHDCSDCSAASKSSPLFRPFLSPARKPYTAVNVFTLRNGELTTATAGSGDL